jgi:uncharacterized protein (DUF58 family)
MGFGTEVRTKLDLAREVVAAIGTVMRRRGDRLGVAATVSGGLDLLRPPRGDRRGLISALAALDHVRQPANPGRTDLGRALTTLGRVAVHRGMVIVVSDLPAGEGLERALGGLSRRHEVVGIELRDRRERDLPRMGALPLRDLETGRRVVVDTADPRFRQRFARMVREADARRDGMLARAGVRHVAIETGQDWLLPLARALSHPRSRRGVA